MPELQASREGAGIRRVALITGAGKRDGIGAGIARALAADGVAVVVSDLELTGVRNQHEPPADASWRGLDTLVNEIRAAGGEASATTGDVSNEADAVGMVDRAVEIYGRLDILVNNAAAPHGGEFGDLEQISVDAWDHVMAVNVRGPFLMARAAVGPMRRQGWGRIINISSGAGKRGIPKQAAYTASKHAVIGLTRSLAVDLGPDGITVNAVCPGQILTSRARDSASREGGGDLQAEMARRAAAIPARRVGLPIDIASLVCYLASDGASYVSAQAISVDGGALPA